VSRREAEGEVDEEIAFHLEMRAAELVRQGLRPDQARQEARRRFGGVHPGAAGGQRRLSHPATSDVDRDRWH
jgi:hypothetical protein